MRLRGSNFHSLKLGAIAFVAASLGGACSHDWDSLDPRLGSSTPGAGGAATNTSAGASIGGDSNASTGATGASNATGSGASSGGGSGGFGGTSSVAVSSTESSANTTVASTTAASSSNTVAASTAVAASSAATTVAASSSSTGGGPTGLVVEYEVAQAGAGTVIGSQLWILNNGNTTVNLSALTLRYYLTITGEVPLADVVSNINWAHTDPIPNGTPQSQYGGITTKVVSMPIPVASADTYIEFSFGGSGDTVPPGFELNFSWTAQNSASKSFIQVGDYSFNSSDLLQTPSTHMVLLQGTTVLYGVEP